MGTGVGDRPPWSQPALLSCALQDGVSDPRGSHCSDSCWEQGGRAAPWAQLRSLRAAPPGEALPATPTPADQPQLSPLGRDEWWGQPVTPCAPSASGTGQRGGDSPVRPPPRAAAGTSSACGCSPVACGGRAFLHASRCCCVVASGTS